MKIRAAVSVQIVRIMRFRSPEQFFSFSLKVFPFPLQFFIICAEILVRVYDNTLKYSCNYS